MEGRAAMKRREFMGALGGAALQSGKVLADDAGGTSPSTADRTEANVRDFGARGDGVTDDWAAIEHAGLYLQQRGGGRLYFPAGRYKLPKFGFNIRTRSNIEYCGDGYASWIDANNCGFCNAGSERGLVFTVGDFPRYTYHPARDLVAGDRFVFCETRSDAAHFEAGEFVYIRSRAETVLGKESWPHFSEYCRILSSDPNTGAIELEDAIEDGWSGIQLAKLEPGIVAANYAIHHLRVTCSAGFPFFIMGSYKSVIHDVWTEGWSALTVNAFTKSEFRDAICQISWSPGDRKTASAVEVETGSVRAKVRNVSCYIRSVDGTQNAAAIAPLVFTQEFSRRTTVRDCRFLAPGLELGNGIFSIGAGHAYENLTFAAKSFDNILRFVADDSLGDLNNVPRRAKQIHAEVSGGYNCAVGLIGTPRSACANIDIDGFKVFGPSGGGASVVLAGAVRDIKLHDLDADGEVRDDGGGRLSNVTLRDSRLSGFADRDILNRVDVVNFRRQGTEMPPAVVTHGDELVSSNLPHAAFRALEIPAHFKMGRGDAIGVHIDVYKFKGLHAAHIALRTFESVVATVDISAGLETYLEIRARIQVLDVSQGRGQILACLGTVTQNGAVRNLAQKTIRFDLARSREVAIEIWGDWPGTSDNLSVRSSRLAYELVENKSAF
jgi:hypothetical protein